MEEKITTMEENVKPSNFIHDFIDTDLAEGVYEKVKDKIANPTRELKLYINMERK